MKSVIIGGVAMLLVWLPATVSWAGEGEKVSMSRPARNQDKKTASIFSVPDVESVRAQEPTQAVRQFELKGRPKIYDCDVLIVGGGMGAVAAAVSAATHGYKICIVEQTSWLGGQLSSQGVSALDENYLVESSGATRTYKNLRQSIRDHYKSLGAVDGGARFEPYLDPGNCWVSRLAFEPSVALKIIDSLLEKTSSKKNKLQVFKRLYPVCVRLSRGKIQAVLMVNLDTGKFAEYRCKFCIDATELGDMLPLAKIPYKSGAESAAETGEEHAPLSASAENVQDFTYPFVLEYCPNEDHRIQKPEGYDQFVLDGKFNFAGYKMFCSSQIADGSGNLMEYLPFWEYRRLISRQNFSADIFPNDLSMINWESNDLRGENIIDKTPEEMVNKLAKAKNLSRGFLYWMQTEAPRDEGGKGYPELKLRYDILGTDDGLSKYPYIRESRRIKAERTIVEHDISATGNVGARAVLFSDSVGIGLYPIDIHGHQDIPGAGQAARPFQIPAGALVQNAIRNFLPACKNIGTTHITNGAYRLHPIEWGIGEAAGHMAAICLSERTEPSKVLGNKKLFRQFQELLIASGMPLFWYDDLPLDHPAFAAAQFLAVTGIFGFNQNNLHFSPDEPLTRGDLACALARLLRLDTTEGAQGQAFDIEDTDPQARQIRRCLGEGILSVSDGGNFNSQGFVSWNDLVAIFKNKSIAQKLTPRKDPLTRADFALVLHEGARSKKFFGRH